MILQEHHRQFAVKCCAQCMTRTKVVKAIMGEFRDELPNRRTEWYYKNRGFLSEYYRINILIFMKIVAQIDNTSFS